MPYRPTRGASRYLKFEWKIYNFVCFADPRNPDKIILSGIHCSDILVFPQDKKGYFIVSYGLTDNICLSSRNLLIRDILRVPLLKLLVLNQKGFSLAENCDFWALSAKSLKVRTLFPPESNKGEMKD